MKQRTLAATIETNGIGLHSGVTVNLKLAPAPPNSGYIFVRNDLDDFEIPASIEYVSHCNYATTLMKNGVVLSTTEHLLAALRGAGLDNVFINVDNIEMPIMDGSSAVFLDQIEKVGTIEQNAPRRFLKICKKVEIEQDNKKMSVEPAQSYDVECFIDFPHRLIGRQTYDFTLSDGSFGREISRARTFGFTKEIEVLRKMNLALGGSLENAIVLDEDEMLNPMPLRY
ncbi:MAG: UDP-3-O-[3-hydroxymyristoyl] N-acetylglucosamine deacetylase, partial [Pyrinomonadaceae bacterium]|nr:UDP-3-O-[3-hydroxymyristoyl] N-acetylglucosamine deacetylase [Pyrinomonadaceae bacterium]